ncbi:hypothetical protein TW85_16415 [Marinomonas sp. S3726]|nr:hypothetical protein TW85_16415 [Marinomonas sp. S3726]
MTDVFEKRLKNKSGKGIDGVDSILFYKNIESNCDNLIKKIASNNYRYTPYLEILKSKGRGREPRVISKPALRDKLVLSVLKDILHNTFPNSVSKKLPNVIIRDIVKTISKNEDKEVYFLKIDIKTFFDSICRDLLLNNIKTKVSSDSLFLLLRRAIYNKTVPIDYRKKDSSKYRREKGVPQGLAISNVLSSIYLMNFDDFFYDKGIYYVRYVDDILIISEKNDIDYLHGEVDRLMGELSLETHSDEKIDKGKITNSFDFLGYCIEYPKVKVRKATEERFIASLAALFTDMKHNAIWREKNSNGLTMDQLKTAFIFKLNEKITGAISDDKRYGWVFYFLEINDFSLLYKIDFIIRDLFKRLKVFDFTPPSELKSLVKSYFEAKNSPYSGYIHNYNIYNTNEEKLSYLIKMGYIVEKSNKSYTPEQIDKLFNQVKGKSLVNLEADLGSMS